MSHTHADRNYQLATMAGLKDHMRREHPQASVSLHDLQWGSRLRLESAHRADHPEAPQFEPSVTLAIYPGSITVPEFRRLRDAADLARKTGEITWLRHPSGDPVAAVVPVQVARQAITDDKARHIARDTVIRVVAIDGQVSEYLVRSVIHAGTWEVTLGVVPYPEGEDKRPPAEPSRTLAHSILEHLANYGKDAYGPSAHDLSLIFCATGRQVQATLDGLVTSGFVTSRHIHDYTMEPARWELTPSGREILSIPVREEQK